MVVMPEPPPSSEHRYGRGGFLLLVAGGASSLLWAGPVSRLLSPVTSAGSQLVGNLFPVGGWRIYTISGSMPIFDPSSWRLEIGGLVKHPRTLTYDPYGLDEPAPKKHHRGLFGLGHRDESGAGCGCR